MFKNKIQTIVYKIAVMFFYCLGDVASKFDSELAFDVYQKSMKVSLKYDEKLDWWFWKETLNTNTTL